MEINLELTSRFCPYCSNDKAVDGSYQSIGCFAIMDQGITFNDVKVLYVDLECPNCHHHEYCNNISEKDKEDLFQKICRREIPRLNKPIPNK